MLFIKIAYGLEELGSSLHSEEKCGRVGRFVWADGSLLQVTLSSCLGRLLYRY